MILPPADAKDFFRIVKHLDVFFTSRLKLLKDASLEEIRNQRAAAFASPGHVEAYVKANPDCLTDADLAEVSAWQQHGVAGRFLALQERKDGCHFMSTEGPPAVYLVQGLTQPISEFVPFLPCYVETRLLPWRGRIVTDGIIAPLMVHFGGNTRTSFKQEAKEVIATRGLITTLPASAPSAPDPAALLRHYLSTAALKAKGLTGHFAILEDTIITGAPDKPTAAACAHALVPVSLQPGIVWLKL